MKRRVVAIAAAALLLLGVGAWFAWHPAPEPLPPAAPGPAEVMPLAPAPVALATPVAEPSATASQAASSTPDADEALVALFGRRIVLTIFHADDFVHRFVATVDNLAGRTATVRLWPLAPVGGRFTVESQGGAEVIGAANAQRYEPYVRLIEDVDLRALAATCRQLYPLFERAYADLGYPNRRFNERLLEVVDLLLATPDAGPVLKVHPPATAASVQSARPWVMYEFDDTALQSLAAGQRILLRMGPDNERRVKARLSALRPLLLAAGSSR